MMNWTRQSDLVLGLDRSVEYAVSVKPKGLGRFLRSPLQRRARGSVLQNSSFLLGEREPGEGANVDEVGGEAVMKIDQKLSRPLGIPGSSFMTPSSQDEYHTLKHAVSITRLDNISK